MTDRTTPCSSCTPSTALHRVHYPICNANQCQQGRTACPVPQACQVAEEAPATRAEITGFWLVVFAAVVSVFFVVFLAASA